MTSIQIVVNGVVDKASCYMVQYFEDDIIRLFLGTSNSIFYRIFVIVSGNIHHCPTKTAAMCILSYAYIYYTI